MKRKLSFHLLVTIAASMAFCLTAGGVGAANKIVHDAEYYILEAQNGKVWEVEDKELDKKLAELKKEYGTSIDQSIARVFNHEKERPRNY